MIPESLQLGQIHGTLGDVQGGPQQCVKLHLVTNFAAFVPNLTILGLLSNPNPKVNEISKRISVDTRSTRSVSCSHSFPILHATSLSNANNMFLMALNQPNSRCLEEAHSTRSLESQSKLRVYFASPQPPCCSTSFCLFLPCTQCFLYHL